jgi:hypothetical protein
VLAGDLGVGPPGDEDEHEPNFALTAEAGGNDGLAAPLVLLGVFVAEQGGTDWIGEWLVADVLYACVAGLVIGVANGWAAAWSVHWLRDRELLAPAFDGYHAVATALITYGLAEVAAATASSRVRQRPGVPPLRARPRAQRPRPRGAEQVEKFMELRRSCCSARCSRARAWASPAGPAGGSRRAAGRHPPAGGAPVAAGGNVETGAGRAFVAWFGVRGVGTLYYAATVVTGGALAAARRRSWCGRRSRA